MTDYSDVSRFSHVVVVATLGTIAFSVGIWMIVSVVRMRSAEGKWPWAAEVPLMVGVTEMGLGILCFYIAVSLAT